MTPFIHPTAEIHPDADIGEGVRIYANTLVGATAIIGSNTTIGRNCEIHGTVGKHCKIQASALIYHGVSIRNWVFIGPRFTTTNDIDPDAYSEDWGDRFRHTIIDNGVCIGASVTVVCGNTIGEHARIGAGSLVTHSIKPRWRAYGCPAHHIRPIPTEAKATLKVEC